MNKSIITSIMSTLSLLIVTSANAQDKKLDKVKQLYENQQYTECIESAKKYNSANYQKPDGYFYLGFSYFELYKQSPQKELNLRNAENHIYTALSKDKSQTVRQQFKNSIDELHNKITEVQDKYFEEGDNNKAETHASMLAKMFNDTTEVYRRIKMPQLFEEPQTYGKIIADYDGDTNQLDITGKKIGTWIKRYPNGKRKSQINFDRDKPRGDYYKFYESGGVSAHLYFYNDDLASAILYAENGDKQAMGYYYQHQKDSLWQYFESDSLLVAEEFYIHGVKNGLETAYFIFGLPSVEINWKDGKKNGVYRQYHESGKVLYEANYVNDVLNGKYAKYDIKGKLLIIGNYKNDLKHGEWKILDSKTDKFNTVKYVNGVLENSDQIDAEETKKIEEQLEKSKLLLDPKDYLNNPSEYIEKSR